MHILSYKGHASVTDLLVCGGDVNLLDEDMKSPLWYAVSNGKQEVVKVLLRFPRLKIHCGITPAHVNDACPVVQAIVKNRVVILKMMILVGYDEVHLRDL